MTGYPLVQLTRGGEDISSLLVSPRSPPDLPSDAVPPDLSNVVDRPRSPAGLHSDVLTPDFPSGDQTLSAESCDSSDKINALCNAPDLLSTAQTLPAPGESGNKVNRDVQEHPLWSHYLYSFIFSYIKSHYIISGYDDCCMTSPCTNTLAVVF